MSCPSCFYKRIARLALTQGIAAIDNACHGNAPALFANQNNVLWLTHMFRQYHKAERQGDQETMTRLEEGRRSA